jgi:tRNA A37 threonylcarbamoyltransferase TsaD
LLAGGVSATKKLRETLAKEVKKHLPHAEFWKPTIQFSGDNGAMIAAAAYFTYRNNKDSSASWEKIEATANLRL